MKEKIIVVSLVIITVLFVFVFATKGYPLINSLSHNYYAEQVQ